MLEHSGSQAAILDMAITASTSKISTKLLDKRDDFLCMYARPS